MGVVLANNASTTLASSITSVDTTMTVNSAATFPALSSGEWFNCTLESTGGTIEIVRVTNISGNVFTMTRAQEGTLAVPFSAGALVELRITVQNLDDHFEDNIEELISNDAYDATTWDGDTDHAASKNAVRDKVETLAVAANTPYRLTNIAALQAQTWTSAEAPQLVTLEYNHVAGDDGGMFRYDSSDTTSSDNNGTTIRTSTSGTNLRYKRLYSGPAKAVWFGYKVGGGDADKVANATAMQRAIDAAYWVELPIGTAYRNAITHTQANRITGHGYDKSIVVLGGSQNTRCISGTNLTAPIYEDFTIDMNYTNNTGSGAHDGIRLDNPTDPVFRNVYVTGARGTFLGSPVGGGVSIANGSGAKFYNYRADNCYDGYVLTNHTDARDEYSELTTNLRSGATIGTGCHRFEHRGVYAVGNATTYAGAGMQIIQADKPKGFGGYFANNLLGHGLQYNTCDTPQQTNFEGEDNGISGLDFTGSINPKVSGGYSINNDIRGLEIDSSSGFAVVEGFTASGNLDIDISVFRSPDVTLIGCEGNVKGWDGGGATGSVTRLSIIGGHQGDTLTLESGACANVSLLEAKFTTVTDPSGIILSKIGPSNIYLSGVIDLGHLSDTTISRLNAGDIGIEGNIVYRAGGTDVPVTDGGTGASSASSARTNLGIGAVGTQGDGDKGDITVSDTGATWTIDNNVVTYAKMQDISATSRFLGRITAGSGDTEELTAANAKTILSLVQADISGLTTADSPQFTAINVGHASDTTITRASAGVIAVEGVNVLTTSAISDTAYDTASWDGDTTHAPSKNAVRDKIESITFGSTASDPGAARVLFKLIGANMNSTADQQFTKVGSFNSWLSVSNGAYRLVNPSISLTTAVGGVYSAASKGGDALVANTQTYTTATTASGSQAMTASSLGNGVRTETPYLSLTTPQGATATADLYIWGTPLA